MSSCRREEAQKYFSDLQSEAIKESLITSWIFLDENNVEIILLVEKRSRKRIIPSPDSCSSSLSGGLINHFNNNSGSGTNRNLACMEKAKRDDEHPICERETTYDHFFIFGPCLFFPQNCQQLN